MTTPTNPQPQPLSFAFPFRTVQGKELVDEHIFYDWLASEGGGSFAVSSTGMWHGGIHVSESGAGRQLDLQYGVRCIAGGEIVAYRVNRTALTSQIAAHNGKPAQTGRYSSAFTLVRHTLEYPADNRLSLFSLYMHLQSVDGYEQRSQAAPAYWARCHEVSQYAADKPKTGVHHGPIPAGHIGLNIRAGGTTSADVLGILPRGARVRIGEKTHNGRWGRIEAIETGTAMPPEVGGLVRAGADKGWVYLGKDHGHLLLNSVVSQAQCDRVVVPPAPIPIEAGGLIGHPGPYWLPDDPARDHNMVHIEVFCGSDLPGFLSNTRAAAQNITELDKLPLLRIDKGVKLFAGHSVDEEGTNAPETAIVQIYSQAALDAFPADRKGPKDNDPLHHADGEPWWRITSANSRHDDIDGWVRNRQMPPKGGVTRESAHAWSDFEPVTGSDAGNPTIFGTVDAWLDHMLCENKPATGDISKLKPLACNTYRALSPMRNESRAVDEMRAHTDNKWLRFRASRLILKHRSEWASQHEYQKFFEQVLHRIKKEPYHDAEVERLKQLVWWDEVRSAVQGAFPSSPEVFHIHPVALVGNFLAGAQCIPLEKAKLLALTITSGFEGGHPMNFGAVSGNFDGQGISYGIVQWNIGQGTLSPILKRMKMENPELFKSCFDASSEYEVIESAIETGNDSQFFNWALHQQSHNLSWKIPFQKLGSIPEFQRIQIDEASGKYNANVVICKNFLHSIRPDLIKNVELVTYCALFDLAVQQNTFHPAENEIRARIASEQPSVQFDMVKIAIEERAKKASHLWVSDCMSRRIGILNQQTFTYTAYGVTKSRENANFNLISDDSSKYVCGI